MRKTIWFDMNNSPHVLILTPIIKELCRRDYDIVLTARHYSQTIPLLEKTGLKHKAIGKHGGKSRVGKLCASTHRIVSLARYIRSQGSISASFCHGSRELITVSKMLGIPSMVMFDYEYTEHRLKCLFANALLIPSVIPEARLLELGYPCDKVYRYPGLKENLYIIPDNNNPENTKDTDLWRDYEDQILVVLRPPSTESHYHNTGSEEMLKLLFSKLDSTGVKTIILPRYPSQISVLRELIGTSLRDGLFVIPEHVIDGPKLVRDADLCISGGGTMIREAAVVGTPAYSIFTGKAGAVDEFLEKQGRMTIIKSLKEIGTIELKQKSNASLLTSPNLASYITDLFIDQIVR